MARSGLNSSVDVIDSKFGAVALGSDGRDCISCSCLTQKSIKTLVAVTPNLLIQDKISVVH